jgi:hypothetical protein
MRPAALLIAPAAFHRVVYRRRLKHHRVRVANRLAHRHPVTRVKHLGHGSETASA